VIHTLLGSTRMNFAANINSPIGETHLLTNLSIKIPSRRDQAWGNKLCADVAFTEEIFCERSQALIIDN
jgi:hypothetical protein